LTLAFGSYWTVAEARSATSETEVVIVGAGAAGLQAADLLRQAGRSYLVLEASDRPGGRIYSRPDLGTDLGLTLDEGANLINSTDRVALKLLKRFQIPYVQRIPHGQDHMIYLFADKVLTQKQCEQVLFRDNAAALKRLAQDQRRRAAGIETKLMRHLTATSVQAYLQEVGADPRLTTLLTSFFWSEYGKRLDEINAHVLHDYFAIDLDKQTFKLIPYTDEAYTVPSGAGQIATHLAAENAGHILYGHKVISIHSLEGGRIEIETETANGIERVRANNVIYAAPLHQLREMDVNVDELSAPELEQARRVTYAYGVKLHMKFRRGFHDVYKFPGIYVTDTGEQIWISSFGQNGAGLLTVLTGPLSSDEVPGRVQRVLSQLEQLAPGVSRLYAGVEQTTATHSYSGALQPGESNDLAINHEHKHWITVGEASGGQLQGYLEGALESATRRTKALIARLRGCERWLSLPE
jgi:monoamine oxidase